MIRVRGNYVCWRSYTMKSVYASRRLARTISKTDSLTS